MSKETIKHFTVRACHDEDPPICGDFGEVVYLVKETTCEKCLKFLADLGRKAIEQAYLLDYFDVPKRPGRLPDHES